MRILAVSDEEAQQIYSATLHDPERPIDMLLGCGDLAYTYMDYLLTQVRTRYAFYVHGNHDQPILLDSGITVDEPLGWENVDRRTYRIKKFDVIVAGLEGCMQYRPYVDYQYTEKSMRLRAQSLVMKLLLNKIRFGRYIDIFIAHSPMLGVHDQKDVAHRGFQIFRNLVMRYQPRLFLHGHTHHIALEPWRTRIGNTEVINVYPYKYIHFTTEGIHVERIGGGYRLD